MIIILKNVYVEGNEAYQKKLKNLLKELMPRNVKREKNIEENPSIS